MKHAWLLALFLLGGCGAASSSLSSRHTAAIGIATAAAMDERIIAAGPFQLTMWERARLPGSPANIYIEGDGLAWLSKYTKSMNPTPPDPTALHLAVRDKAENVLYMARPCQYSGWSGEGACPDLYWTTGRTAPEVIQAYHQALDNIKATYNLSGFHLIGYSGGAGVAALVAAERTDILSLRTVAGNTDYTTFAAIHNVSAMDASRNPVDAAAKIAQIPQRHFIGASDKIITPAIFESWKQASGATTCIESVVVPDTSHEKGWREKWQELLRTPPSCTAALIPSRN